MSCIPTENTRQLRETVATARHGRIKGSLRDVVPLI